MPVPIISRQRALSQVGEIRCGGERKTNAPGAKLDAFRLTSQQRDILETAARLWGGEVKPWQSPTGEAWQLYTTASALPCMVVVGYSLHRVYELWEGATRCTRRCDGIEEQLGGQPCLCNAENVDRCDTITRLMVMLPETGTSLGWRLRSTGEIAADELDGAMMVAERLAQGRAFVPAVLRLTQRRSVSDGQTKRYVVPVLDFNLMGELAGQHALPAPAEGEVLGYTPLPEVAGTTLEQGLDAINGAPPETRHGRSPQPMGEMDDYSEQGAPSPEPAPIAGQAELVIDVPASSSAVFVDHSGPLPTAEPEEPASSDGARVTEEQKGALNALYGELTRAGAATVEQIYVATAALRGGMDVEEMIVILEGRKKNGELSFARLRDSLSRGEASNLIGRLGRLADNVRVAP